MENRAFPHNPGAERSVLGSMIQDEAAIDQALAAGLKSHHFYRPDHAALYELIVAEVANDGVIDMVTLPEIVSRTGRQQDYGGIAYVVSLPDHVPSTANVEHYAELIVQDWRRREVIRAMSETMDMAFRAQEDPRRVAQSAVGALLDGALHADPTSGGWVAMPDVLMDALGATQRARDNPDLHGGLPSGFRGLDQMIGNLHPGDLVILAARPAMGKTALALNILENVVTNRVIEGHAGMFSLEMGNNSLGHRSLASASGVSGKVLKTGRMNDREYDAVNQAYGEIKDKLCRLHIDATPNLTISEIGSRARQLKHQVGGKLSLIVIDYLQLISGELGPRVSREQEVSNMSRKAKLLAKDLGIPVLLLAQLNRQCEQRQDKRPIMSDLRESGAVEQDADVIVFLFRGEYYWPKDRKLWGMAEAIVAKARNGSTGDVPLRFHKAQTQFVSLNVTEQIHWEQNR